MDISRSARKPYPELSKGLAHGQLLEQIRHPGAGDQAASVWHGEVEMPEDYPLVDGACDVLHLVRLHSGSVAASHHCTYAAAHHNIDGDGVCQQGLQHAYVSKAPGPRCPVPVRRWDDQAPPSWHAGICAVSDSFATSARF